MSEEEVAISGHTFMPGVGRDLRWTPSDDSNVNIYRAVRPWDSTATQLWGLLQAEFESWLFNNNRALPISNRRYHGEDIALRNMVYPLVEQRGIAAVVDAMIVGATQDAIRDDVLAAARVKGRLPNRLFSLPEGVLNYPRSMRRSLGFIATISNVVEDCFEGLDVPDDESKERAIDRDPERFVASKVPNHMRYQAGFNWLGHIEDIEQLEYFRNELSDLIDRMKR